MSKKTFIVFGLVVIFLAVLIPWLAFRSDGDAARGAQKVPSDLKEGQSLFQTNCGTCHTLYAAGTDGNFAPNLDELLAPTGPPSGEGAEATINATKNASSTPSTTASTARRPPAGCRPESSTANRPKKSPNSSPPRPARARHKRRLLRMSAGARSHNRRRARLADCVRARLSDPPGQGLRPVDGPEAAPIEIETANLICHTHT